MIFFLLLPGVSSWVNSFLKILKLLLHGQQLQLTVVRSIKYCTALLTNHTECTVSNHYYLTGEASINLHIDSLSNLRWLKRGKKCHIQTERRIAKFF